MKFDLLRAVPDRLTIAEALRSPDARPGRRGFRHDGESSPLARWLAVSLLPLATLVLSTGAQANQLQVSATIAGSCTTEGGTVAFGNYTGEAINIQPTFTILCTPGSNFSIHLSEGGFFESGDRQMSNGNGGRLLYQLFQDEEHGTAWGGNGVNTPKAITNFSAANHGTQQVFATIPQNQNALAGTYNDSVAITFSF